MTQIIQFNERNQAPKKRPAKKKASRPQNALSSAERAELDERINMIASRFKNRWLIKKAIRDDIRKSCGVGRYYHMTPSQMTSYIDELNATGYRAYVFARVCHAFEMWDSKNLEKVFIDCDLDIDRFIERIIQ